MYVLYLLLNSQGSMVNLKELILRTKIQVTTLKEILKYLEFNKLEVF